MLGTGFTLLDLAQIWVLGPLGFASFLHPPFNLTAVCSLTSISWYSQYLVRMRAHRESTSLRVFLWVFVVGPRLLDYREVGSMGPPSFGMWYILGMYLLGSRLAVRILEPWKQLERFRTLKSATPVSS